MFANLIGALWLAGAPAFSAPRPVESALRRIASQETTCSQDPSTCAAIAEFADRVKAYMLVRQEAARDLPSERVFGDPADMLSVRAVLRRAIREARPNARAGDLFTPRAATAFRHIVAVTAAKEGVDPRDVVHALRADRLPGAKQPAVNGPYDWRLGAWMWPALLLELPPLPAELQYRIVDDDLVIIDLRASLVVDILDDLMTIDED
jgi:hypothetical protein